MSDRPLFRKILPLLGRRRGDAKSKAQGQSPQPSTGSSTPRPATRQKSATAGPEGVASDISAWDSAYDKLKEAQPKLINEYELLLSAELSETEDIYDPQNRIPQSDPIARRETLKEIIGLGQKHTDEKKLRATVGGHEIVLQDVAANVAGAIEWAEDYIKDATSGLPYASVIMAGVSLVLPLLKNPPIVEAAHKDGFAYVTSQMRYYAEMESLLSAVDQSASLKAELADLYQLIIEFQVRSVIRFYRNSPKNFLRGTINYDGWDEKLQKIKTCDKELVTKWETVIAARSLQRLRALDQQAEESRKALDGLLAQTQELVAVSLDHLSYAQRMDRRMSNAENRACLEHLQGTDPRLDKERIQLDKGGLLHGSYRWVLENDEFCQWRDNNPSPLLWIRGDPGKGKTMLLCGIIDELGEGIECSNSNITFFFCQATDANINNASAVLRGLIYMLVKQQPSLMSHLRAGYDRAGKQSFQGTNAFVALSDVFNSILRDAQLRTSYVIIDALDECSTGLDLLLSLIVKSSTQNSRVKWMVSSRNWTSIEKDLHDATQKVILSLETNKNAISEAVAAYIRFKVDKLATRHKYSTQTYDAVQHYLSDNAQDTFLWVALVCQELWHISSWDVEAKLTANEFPSGLDHFYNRMLQHIRGDALLSKRILAVISIVYRPITVQELAALIGKTLPYSNLEDAIGMCGSFLMLRDNIISFVHQSAKDYVVKTASGEIFPDGIPSAHDSVFLRSVEVMSKILKRDIYDLKTLGFSIGQVQSPDSTPLGPVVYSCVFWVEHLCSSALMASHSQTSVDTVDTFLRAHFLHWLEALSLLQSLPQGILSIAKLDLTYQKQGSKLAPLIRDGHRFVQYFRLVIETNPLQLYTSALLFSPNQSIIRNLFEQQELLIPMRTKPLVEDNWNACIQTLEGHGGWVESTAFLPDGQLLASGSNDSTIKIWDVATGSCTQTLKGHNDWVLSIAFSPDSQSLASGSKDTTIKIWDMDTGSCNQTLEGHGGSVESIAFSPNNHLLASGSDDTTIKLWDVATGSCTQTLKGHSDWVLSIAFSPDSQSLASGSKDTTIKIWDMDTGSCNQTLVGHSSSVASTAFSFNGQWLASGSYDETIKIWDVTTWSCVQTLNDHDCSVYSVAFSLNNQSLASGSDQNMKIWDIATRSCIQTLKLHSDSVRSVAFSPDNHLLASGSEDMTIKIWDIATKSDTQTLECHSTFVQSIAFSPDNQLFASGSYEDIKIWDVATRSCIQTLEGHSDWVLSIAFSPDSQLLASGSEDMIIKIWDMATGSCTQTLHTVSPVQRLAFDPDPRYLSTNFGTIDLHLNIDQNLNCTPDAPIFGIIDTHRTPAPQSSHGSYSISPDGTWIAWNNELVLWLPPEYRPSSSDVAGTSVAIGTGSGRVFFLTFSTNVPFI